MTTLTFPTPRSYVAWLKPVGTFLTDLATGIRMGSEMAARYDRLSRLSDADLARRGLTRADIPAAAVGVKRY